MMTKYVKTTDSEEDLRLAFRVWDKDANGLIDCDEIRNILRFSGVIKKEEIEDMIFIVDVDGDGRINYSGTEKIIYTFLKNIFEKLISILF
jgi:calmodulin